MRDRYFEDQNELHEMVDSKLMAEINEKKRAQGIKQ